MREVHIQMAHTRGSEQGYLVVESKERVVEQQLYVLLEEDRVLASFDEEELWSRDSLFSI
jgi:hypothetical protein